MATKNLLVKDFIQKRVPGGTTQQLVYVPDPDPFLGDSQNASATVENEWQTWDGVVDGGSSSITTEYCLAQGGAPIGGYCTISVPAYNYESGQGLNFLTKFRVVD